MSSSRDVFEVVAEIQIEGLEIRDLDGRLLGIGRLGARGSESGAETESPVAYIVQVKNAKAVRVVEYLDPDEALQAAGAEE